MTKKPSQTRTIVYLEDWFNGEKVCLHGEKENVPINIAENMIRAGIADIFEQKQPTESTFLPEQEGFLPIRGYSYWEKYKDDKNFFVEGMLYPQTTNMLYSPPGGFKSLLSLLLGACVSTGRPFLGLKTKKFPVLILDKENPRKTIKKRFIAIRKGLNLHQKTFPLYYLAGEGDLDSLSWIETLKKTIEHYKIRLVIFDTLHRFSDYEENAADDLNRLYSTVFQPLTQKHDCAVLFLHHCTKEGNYRGTSDFLGQVDTAWSLRREGKTGNFVLINEKNRSGELERIEGSIDFGDTEENSIRVEKKSLANQKIDAIGRISTLKEVSNEIMSQFSLPGVPLKRSQILTHFDILRENNRDYSLITIRRSLNWLVLNDFLIKNDKGMYKRNQGTVFEPSMSHATGDNSQKERV